MIPTARLAYGISFLPSCVDTLSDECLSEFALVLKF